MLGGGAPPRCTKRDRLSRWGTGAGAGRRDLWIYNLHPVHLGLLGVLVVEERMLGAGMEATAGTRTGNHHAGIAPVMVVNEACRLLAPCERTRWHATARTTAQARLQWC